MNSPLVRIVSAMLLIVGCATSVSADTSYDVTFDKVQSNLRAGTGELRVDIKNTSSEALEYNLCSLKGFVRVSIFDATGAEIKPTFRWVAGTRCPNETLQPGETREEYLGLNYLGYTLSPGSYRATVSSYDGSGARSAEIPVPSASLMFSVSP